MRMEAKSRAYHPICEYLEELEWDGQERIRYVLQRYMGADASDFVYEVVLGIIPNTKFVYSLKYQLLLAGIFLL